MGLVSLESIDTVEEKEKVYAFIQEHVAMTGSTVGQSMLENWESEHKKFVKVFPHDYKRVLEERAAAKQKVAA
jgi:glutamate synthase domain-containing protein 3